MELIEIEEGLFIQPRAVAAVKAAAPDGEKCTIFLKGQSAVDGGFLVNRSAADVVEEIDEALEDE